jgi:hypothetical protein
LYFWIANWKTKNSAPNDSKHSLSQFVLNFLMSRSLNLFGVVPKYLKFATLSKDLLSTFLHIAILSCALFTVSDYLITIKIIPKFQASVFIF